MRERTLFEFSAILIMCYVLQGNTKGCSILGMKKGEKRNEIR
jgi:hypothetical protein